MYLKVDTATFSSDRRLGLFCALYEVIKGLSSRKVMFATLKKALKYISFFHGLMV
jgi:hypothetical protein